MTMDGYKRSSGSRFVTEIELADEAAAVAPTGGGAGTGSSRLPPPPPGYADHPFGRGSPEPSARNVLGEVEEGRQLSSSQRDKQAPSCLEAAGHGRGRCAHAGDSTSDQDHGGDDDVNSGCFQFMCWLLHELRHSLTAYAREWTSACRPRTLYVALLLAWACQLLPALALGTWLAGKTRGHMGAAELLVSALISGAMSTALGKQPTVLLLGVTAPCVLMLAAVAATAHRLSLPLLPCLAWTGLWCAACLVLLAALLAVAGAKLMPVLNSRFWWEVLQLVAGMSLLWEACALLLDLLTTTTSDHGTHTGAGTDARLLSLWLATCTAVLAIFLTGAAAWNYFNTRILELLHIAGPAIALLLFSVVPLLPLLSRPHLPKLSMPNMPDHTNAQSKFGAIVSFKAVPTWTAFAAFIPGSLLATLIFFDHLSTTFLVQDALAAGRKLYNHRARSWDIFLIAASVLLCSFFGLPFSYGLSAQSVMHAHALTATTGKPTGSSCVDMENQQRSAPTKPCEAAHRQRLSAMLVSLSAAIFLLPPSVHLIRQVPQGVIAGLLFQMGVLSLKDLTITHRVKALFVDLSKDPSRAQACHLTVRVYSIVQASCAVTVFAVTKTAAAALFPLFLLLIIWLRKDLLRHFFSNRELKLLDSKLCSPLPDDMDADTDLEHHFPCPNPPGAAARQLTKSLTNSGPHSLRKLLRERLSGGHSGPLAAAGAVEATASFSLACHSLAQQQPAGAVGVGSESARSFGSPTLLTMATRRRLKERSRRRYKRKISSLGRVSSLEATITTASSSNVKASLQSRHRLTTSSPLKKHKGGSSNYPALVSTHSGAIHKKWRPHAPSPHSRSRPSVSCSRQFEFEKKAAVTTATTTRGDGDSCEKTTLITSGPYHQPSSHVQVHHASSSAAAKSLCLDSACNCGGHMVGSNKFKKPAAGAAATAAREQQAQIQQDSSPGSSNALIRKSLPMAMAISSPFRQAYSPWSTESQKLHANSLFDPDWKDSSPTSQSMQVHENLAYHQVGGESGRLVTAPAAAKDDYECATTSDCNGAPPPSPAAPTDTTFKISAPLAPNQPLLHDFHEAWELAGSSSATWNGADIDLESALHAYASGHASAADRVSSFRLCSEAGEACCYSSGSGNGSRGPELVQAHSTGTNVQSFWPRGNSEARSAEPWNDSISRQTNRYHHQCDDQGTELNVLHDTVARQGQSFEQLSQQETVVNRASRSSSNNSSTVSSSSSLRRSGHHNRLDVSTTFRDYALHCWEPVHNTTYPPSETMRASRFRLTSEVPVPGKIAGTGKSLDSWVESAHRLPPSSRKEVTALEAVTAAAHHNDLPENSSFQFSATGHAWTSPNSRTKSKSGSGSAFDHQQPSSRAVPQRPTTTSALKPLQRTPERNMRKTKRRSSSSELTDHSEERVMAKLPKQPIPVWR